MKKPEKEKVYLITGSSGGIGSAIARVIARNIEKGTILLHYNSSKASVDKLKKEVESKKIKVELFQANLETKAGCERLCQQVFEKFSVVDVLVNNAGVVEGKELKERSYEDFENTLKINLLAPFYLSKVFGQKMFEQKSGKIVNISSENGLILHSGCFNPTTIDYDATKAGLNVLTKDFAVEFAPYVNVNAVAPGWVDTPMNYQLPEYARERENANILKKRWAKPEEIAELAWFLMSDKAEYINGSIYEIDGGTL